MDITTILTHPIALFFGEPINAVVSIVILLVFYLAWRTLYRDAKNPVNIYFALTSTMVGFWLIGILGYRMADLPLFISLFVRLVFLAATLVAFFHFMFSYHFPYKTFALSLKQKFFLGISLSFTLLIVLIPGLLIETVVPIEQRYTPEASTFWHIVFAVYFVTLMAWGFKILWNRFKDMDGIWKKRLRQVLIGISVASAGPTVLSLFIPIVYSHRYEWIGSFFTLFLVCYIWYNVFYIPNRKMKN